MRREYHGEAESAMVFAWHVGAMVLVMVGLMKTLAAPLGNAVRRWVPPAGLLGSLAAIALALIAFLPLLNEIAVAPPVGFLALLVVLAALVAIYLSINPIRSSAGLKMFAGVAIFSIATVIFGLSRLVWLSVATLAVIGVVVGELVGGNTGLGYLLTFGEGAGDTAMVFVAIILLTLIGILLYGAVVLLEGRVLHYLPARARAAA